MIISEADIIKGTYIHEYVWVFKWVFQKPILAKEYIFMSMCQNSNEYSNFFQVCGGVYYLKYIQGVHFL